jgi:hypothetical protein
MLRLSGLLERNGLLVLRTCPFCAFVRLITLTCIALELGL